MILFFGDSFTSAENNNFNGFVEKLNNKSYINLGVSGTCIGDYSLYPVGDTNLINLLYKEEKRIKESSIIFLEYGSNDISSLICNYVSRNQIIIDLKKSLDFIYQINPNIKIYFIDLGSNIERFARGQVKYLLNDYFKDVNKLLFNDLNEDALINEWINEYKILENVFDLLNIRRINMPILSDADIDKDGIHPNDLGYFKISKELMEVINGK